MVAVGALVAGDPAWLGAYELVGRLGEGGQSVVYLGRDRSGRHAAVKVLRAQLSESPEWRARFVRELSVIERVAGFCTAQVLDADVAGHLPYVVSEYVPGPSLSQLVRGAGPRTGTDLDRLAIGTVTAVTAIHRAGILHRDLKPSNVLMGPDGPRVIDFGISRVLAAGATTSSGVVGTPSYMAPEQVTEGELGTAVDMFAWAATMLFAATGRQPFGHDSISAVFQRILHEEPDLSPLPARLRELVGSCLAKDPAARPDAQQVLLALLGGQAPVGPDSALATGSSVAQGARPASAAGPPASAPSSVPQLAPLEGPGPEPPLEPSPRGPAPPEGTPRAGPGVTPLPPVSAMPAARSAHRDGTPGIPALAGPAEPGQRTAEHGPVRSRLRRPVQVAALVIPVAALVVVVGVWWLPSGEPPARPGGDTVPPPTQAREATAIAPAALKDVFDYDYRTVERDIATARGRMTPGYRAQFDGTLADLRGRLRSSKGSVATTVLGAAAVSATADRVGVLAFVRRAVRGNGATSTVRDAVRVTLVRQGGAWLVDTQNVLKAGSAADILPGATWPGGRARAVLAAAAGQQSIAGSAVLASGVVPDPASGADPAEVTVLVTVAERSAGGVTGKIGNHRLQMRRIGGRWTATGEQPVL